VPALGVAGRVHDAWRRRSQQGLAKGGRRKVTDVGRLRDKAARRRATFACDSPFSCRNTRRRTRMNAIIYLVGLVVIVMAILSFVGMR
jgi:hypothetical protein